jgi:hypothetical protein
MNEFADNIAGALISAGAVVVAIPGEANFNDIREYQGRKFKFDQHFYLTFRLREEDRKDYIINYLAPGSESLGRLAYRLVRGRVLSVTATGKDLSGDLGFLNDAYPAGYCREMKFTGLRADNLDDRIIGIDGVAYVVIQSYQGNGYLNVLLDRPLDQPVTHTSVVTGGWEKTRNKDWGINSDGLLIGSVAMYPARDGRFEENYTRNGVTVRHSRHVNADDTTTETFDTLLAMSVQPDNCWAR